MGRAFLLFRIEVENRTFPGSFFCLFLYPEISPNGSIPGYQEQFLRNRPHFCDVTCSRRFCLSAQSPAIENNSFGIVHVSIEYEPISQSLSAGQIFDSRSVEGEEWKIELPLAKTCP